MRRLALIALFAAGCRSSADLLLTNGRVFTADPARPWATAVAIRGDRIVAVEPVPAKRTIDLQGLVVVPASMTCMCTSRGAAPPLDLQNAASVDDVYKSVAAAAGDIVQAVIPVTMFDDSTLTPEALDRVTSGREVILRNPAGHAALLSGKGWFYETDLWLRFRTMDDAASDAAIEAEMRRFADEAIRTASRACNRCRPFFLTGSFASQPKRRCDGDSWKWN